MESIHNYEKSLEGITKRIELAEAITQQNKILITKFRNECFANNISLARIVRYMYCLRDLAIWIKKDFDKCNIDDIKSLIALIERMSNYSPRTKYEYRTTIKKFYKWLRQKDSPEEVAWISLNFKKNNDKLPSELLTEQNIMEMVKVSKSSRDRALIISLYESGCRVGEFLKMKMKDLIFEKPGCIFMVNGKTGGRRIRVISSEPYIIDWINKHPDNNNPNAFLWLENKSLDMLQYAAFCKVLRVHAKRAEIKKKVNPHNFRHARATYLANKFTEQQLKVFFGWTRSSDMASVYVHLSGKDVDSALLEAYGIEEASRESKINQAKTPYLFNV